MAMGEVQQSAGARAPDSRALQRARRGRRWREALTGYLFILPAVTILAVFHFFPILYALLLSLYEFSFPRGLIPLPEWFVGAQNYDRLLHDRVFGQAFANTVWYAVGTILAGLSISLGLALLLERIVRGRT